MLKNILAITLHDLRLKSRSLWYPIVISLALVIFTVMISNNWQHVLNQGVVTGDLLITPFRFALGILLLSSAFEAAIAIPSEKESGTLDWLLLQPVSRFSIIIGKFIAMFIALILSTGIFLCLACISCVIAGITEFHTIPGLLVSVLFSSFYIISLGLLLGNIAHTVKSSVGLTLVLLLLIVGFSLLRLWLALRPIASTYDPYYSIAVLVTQLYNFTSWFIPVSLFENIEIFSNFQNILVGLVSVIEGFLLMLFASSRLISLRGMNK